MKFSLFDKFGALNSQPVWHAFRSGLDRHGIARCQHEFNADVAVIWSVVWAGRMRANRAVWQHYRQQGRTVVVLEVGLLQRGTSWKIGINGTGQGSQFCQDWDDLRPQRLGIDCEPWRAPGDNIVIFCQREDSEQWQGQPSMRDWLDSTAAQIRSVSDRPIMVRPHPRRPAYQPAGTKLMMPLPRRGTYDDYDVDHALASAWCCVNHNSGPGSISAIKGVPVFTDASSLAAPVSEQDWNKIESPQRPDRAKWLIDICHTEWTLPEIEQGVMLEQLLARIKTL